MSESRNALNDPVKRGGDGERDTLCKEESADCD